MIWIARDLTHWTETEKPHYWANTVTFDGKVFRRLTRPMFEALQRHVSQSIDADEKKRFTALANSINAIGRERIFDAIRTENS